MSGQQIKKLGINGLGRIGKLTLWHHISRRYFDEIVVNIGRRPGTSFTDIVHYLERDSTYGSLHAFLHGNSALSVIENIDENSGTITIDGIKVSFLLISRNPADIGWREHGVKIVVDTTGKFLDPGLPAEHPEGSLRGHLHYGAEKVIASAPFKIKEKDLEKLKDITTTVMGINDSDYDPRIHKIISNASCTTNCLAHMIKPLLNKFGSQRILSASMATVHASTGSQSVLDRLPKTGKEDLRKNRSIMNNIILTSTGAAKALAQVIPEMDKIGFIAESVRIPTSTGSLIILVVNLQEDLSGPKIDRKVINNIYKEAASIDGRGYLHYTEKQNVSGDIIGNPKAAAIIEGHETHTRTANVTIDLKHVSGLPEDILSSLPTSVFRTPVTQAVIYGWYDNEMGSYVNMMGDRTVSVHELI